MKIKYDDNKRTLKEILEQRETIESYYDSTYFSVCEDECRPVDFETLNMWNGKDVIPLEFVEQILSEIETIVSSLKYYSQYNGHEDGNELRDKLDDLYDKLDDLYNII